MRPSPSRLEETTYRGVRWRREGGGGVSFYDADGDTWIPWTDDGGAPPLPPKWGLLGRPIGITRPGWRSHWRIIPVVLVVAAVIIAIVQAERPNGNPVAKEAAASQGLLGKCLPQDGTSDGHPRYSTKTVACGSSQAAVKVVQVLATTPGSPGCPSGTTGVLIPYTGVQYPHVECVQPVTSTG